MAATADTATATATVVDSSSADELAAKAVHKRYEGLIMVRTKAVKGKGAWYWVHLEPMLAYNNETGLPKAVKLRCLLCNAVFSASNPSRTASEHLKRGTCPNFNTHIPKPISSISPPSNNRKRPPDSCPDDVAVLPRQQNQQQLVLSGGKEDLGALALLEDSVKRLRSPKTSPGPALSKSQIECAFHFLSDWVYESCGAVSFSSLDHPKFRAFMNQVGMPVVSKREFIGPRLDVKYEEVKAESEARIGDAMFFQVASDGWKLRSSCGNYFDGANLVNLSVNLPNGTILYRQAIFVGGLVPSKYVEEVLWETITGICGNGGVQRCVGIVADRFKAKALRNLENQNYWMVNLSCQLQGFISLIKDFSKELPLFRSVIDNCFKVANFFNNKTQIRRSFSKYQMQEYGHSNSGLLRVPFNKHCDKDFEPVYAMLEDVLSSARAFHLVLMDESYKVVEMEDAVASEVADMVGGVDFWNQLEAVHSLIKLIKEMAREIEAEKPLVGQCLPLWNELRAKVKDWCLKFHITEGAVEKVIERRFNKNYHPAWSTAYVLDPRYLIRESSGKYLPPFKLLNSEQDKDVDRLITRLVSREEAHVALMELMKWRTEGLDSVYAKAVQMKERDPATGKIRIVNPQSGRLVWETYLTKFKALGKVAVRLIFLHATSCGFKCNPSLLRWVCSHGHSRIGMEKAQKLIFVAANSKLERRESSSEEVNDADLFELANGEDDVLNEVYVDTSSV